MNKTKIIATICGLPLWTQSTIIDAIENGVGLFRISSSFRTREEDAKIVSEIRKACEILKRKDIQIIHDINKGVKNRLQTKEHRKVYKGEGVIIETKSGDSTSEEIIFLDWEDLPQHCSIGQIFIIGDGEIAFKIMEINNSKIHLECLNDGLLKSKKAVTVEGLSYGNMPINQDNIEDIGLSAELDLDYVALSFVKTEKDVIDFWEIVNSKYPNYAPKLIAKIETQEALDNIESILINVDGLMIARGDLALQVNYSKLGVIQKQLLSLCKKKNKFCIVATQMLESVIHNFIPSRAEILDISNAVYSGADALMLGPETCINPQPIRAISTMWKIICAVETDISYGR